MYRKTSDFQALLKMSTRSARLQLLNQLINHIKLSLLARYRKLKEYQLVGIFFDKIFYYLLHLIRKKFHDSNIGFPQTLLRFSIHVFLGGQHMSIHFVNEKKLFLKAFYWS